MRELTNTELSNVAGGTIISVPTALLFGGGALLSLPIVVPVTFLVGIGIVIGALVIGNSQV